MQNSIKNISVWLIFMQINLLVSEKDLNLFIVCGVEFIVCFIFKYEAETIDDHLLVGRDLLLTDEAKL